VLIAKAFNTQEVFAVAPFATVPVGGALFFQAPAGGGMAIVARAAGGVARTFGNAFAAYGAVLGVLAIPVSIAAGPDAAGPEQRQQQHSRDRQSRPPEELSTNTDKHVDDLQSGAALPAAAPRHNQGRQNRIPASAPPGKRFEETVQRLCSMVPSASS